VVGLVGLVSLFDWFGEFDFLLGLFGGLVGLVALFAWFGE
jgi:hypothetical protein